MTRLGTAFVEIKPDWSGFDRTVAAHLPQTVGRAGDDSGREFDDRFQRGVSGLFVPLGKQAKQFERDVAKIRVDLPEPKVKVPVIPSPKLPTVLKDGLDVKARIDLQIEGADAQIQALNARIQELRSRDATVQVKTDIARAIAELDRVEAKRRDLDGKRASLNVDVDKNAPGMFDAITSSVRGLFTSLTGGGGGGMDGAVARIDAGFVSFGSVVGPLAAILAGLAITIGVSLAGAFAALAASAAAAAAGLGAIAAAAGGVLAPALALGAATAFRLTKVFEALKAQDTAADELGRRTAAGSQIARAAIEQQASASRALRDAQERLGPAARQAFREMQDAAEVAADAIRGVESAHLSLDAARLSTREATNELAKFRAEAGATGKVFEAVFDKFTDVSVDTSGLRQALVDANKAAGGPRLDTDQELRLERLILNVREARLREKDAVDGVSDAERTRARAIQRNNEFTRQGIKASEQYRAALHGVETATLAVARAQRQQGLTEAQTRAEQLTSRLTVRERELLAAIKEVRAELRGAFTRATDAAFGGVTRALGRLPLLVNPLRGAFTRLGDAWGKAVDAFSQDLVKPRTVNELRGFTDAAAELSGPIQRGMSALLTIFLNIATAALPHLVSGTKAVASQLQSWAKSTSDQKHMSDVIGGLVDHLKVWLGVGKAVADVFLAFFQSAAGPGKDLAEQIRVIAENTAKWLRSDEGRAELKKFFGDIIPFAKDFVGFLARLVAAATRFGRVTARALAKVIDLFGGAKGGADALVAAVTTLAALKFARSLVSGAQSVAAGMRVARRAAILLHAQLTTTTVATRVLSGVQTAFRRVMDASAVATLRQRAAIVATRVAAIAARAVTVAWVGAQAALNAVLLANPIGLIILAVAGLVAGFVLLGGKLSTITGAFKTAFGFISGVVARVAGAIKDAVSGVASAIVGAASDAFNAAVDLIGNIVEGVRSVTSHVAGAVSSAVRGALNAIGGFFTRMFNQGKTLLNRVRDGITDVAGGIAGAVRGAITGAIDAISGLLGRLRRGGERIGRAMLDGIKNILSDVGGVAAGVGKAIANAVIGLLNKAIPNKIPLPGPIPDIDLPDNPIPKFRLGGRIPGTGSGDKIPILAEPGEFMIRKRIVAQFGPTVFADLNEGRLDPTIGYQAGQRPRVQTVPVAGPMLNTGGLVGAAPGSAGTTINATFPITVPGGGPPDPVALAALTARRLRRVGGTTRAI